MFLSPHFYIMTTDGIRKAQKRTRLKISEQIEASLLLRQGHNTAQIMSKFFIYRHLVANLKAKAETLLQKADRGSI